MVWTALAAASLLLGWGTSGSGDEPWKERRYRGRTTYARVGDGAEVVLHAETRGQNSALLTRRRIDPRGVVLRWRWRVLAHPAGADPEVRARDDRAAGVLVIVHESWIPGRTRALLYQWTPAHPRGAWSRSPYSGRVATLVLEDAPSDSLWRVEARDLEADLARAFGRVPARIAGLGVISDADNTRGHAAAEFGSLEVLTGPEARAALAPP